MNWFGVTGEALAETLGLPQVAAYARVASSMDAAHELAAAGASAGTLVLAEEQTVGRGRGGRSWSSAPGRGIWMTLIERPRTTSGLDVLSLRVGLRLAPVLDRWANGAVQLKWPNDLYVDGRKLAGVLIEARWRGERAEWVAIGVGVNLVPPVEMPEAAGLDGADAHAVLAELVPALRAAAFAEGALTPAELVAFSARDYAAGRRLHEPYEGTARGISSAGELLVETANGIMLVRAGSLVLAAN